MFKLGLSQRTLEVMKGLTGFRESGMNVDETSPQSLLDEPNPNSAVKIVSPGRPFRLVFELCSSHTSGTHTHRLTQLFDFKLLCTSPLFVLRYQCKANDFISFPSKSFQSVTDWTES